MRPSAQFPRFLLVGAIGFLIDASVLQLLLERLNGGLFVSRVFSYVAAATVTWGMHRHYSFREGLAAVKAEPTHRSLRAAASQWVRFLVTNGLGALINYGAYAASILSWDLCRQYPVLGVAVGSAAGLGFNYEVSRRYVFVPEPRSCTVSVENPE